MGPTDIFEVEARRCGYRYVAGLDEAGRGPLAGPVVAAAVIFPRRCRVLGLNDSKQLSPAQRDQLYMSIRDRATMVGVGSATEKEIDRLNILEATRLAMQRAIASMPLVPDFLLVDALTLPCLSIPQRAIVTGDCLSLSIAAASVIAKVTRDRMMAGYHRDYPEYNFLSHKGYCTREHLRLLTRHGPCAIHRRTFWPVTVRLARLRSAAARNRL
ncbi:MAG: ribonuclease HII [Nitrospiraceae bacterium]